MLKQSRGRLLCRFVAVFAFVIAALVVPPRVKSQATALLTVADVTRIVNQAANEARAANIATTIAVTDRYGALLAIFQMSGAVINSARIDGPAPGSSINPVIGPTGTGIQGLVSGGPNPLAGALLSKAGTAALLSTNQNAFTTRTASFIIQPNFPPDATNTIKTPISGPLFGVQFSSLACDVIKVPPLPFGISGDPGGVPLYKNGQLVGGVSVEGDGAYTIDRNPFDDDAPLEERVALAGQQGFQPDPGIRADTVFIDGVRLPYAIAQPTTNLQTPVLGTYIAGPNAAGPSPYVPTTTVGGVPGTMDPRYPVIAGTVLTAQDVAQILDQAAQQALITRAAIRQPIGSNARVTTAVVDVNGQVLGVFQNVDAPIFGFDVSVQKARTSNFFSGTGASSDLILAGLTTYLPQNLPFDGTIAWSTRAVGFIAQPYFAPGLSGSGPGPLSRPLVQWSVFNTGLQLDMSLQPLVQGILTGNGGQPCTQIPRLPNGITIFPGGIPLYKNGQLAGAIGISGDGVDQDDLIAAAGATGFDQLPATVQRSDTLIYNGTRLPYLKFPRNPNLSP